jgi:penicillin-binding protein activator
MRSFVKDRLFAVLLAMMSTLQLTSCATNQARHANPSGAAVPPVEVVLGRQGPVAGVGVEGRDIISMSDQMARDILASRQVVGAGGQPPRVIIDAEYFRVEGSQPINKGLITQRLLVQLNRAAQGQLRFVGRRHAGMVAEERALKRDGQTDVGTKGLTKAQLGADYRLAGTFMTLDSRSNRTGMIQRYTQITFELIDLESSEQIWANQYEIERAAADDVIYR